MVDSGTGCEVEIKKAGQMLQGKMTEQVTYLSALLHNAGA